jgi:ATP/maltotriose-dependent transcriptional regulator MalT
VTETSPDAAGAVRARRAAERSAWDEVCDAYASITDRGVLAPDDLEQWAVASYLIGRVDATIEQFIAAYDANRDRDDVEAALRDGFWIVFTLLHHGDVAQASGWWSRCESALQELAADSIPAGYFKCLQGFRLAASDHRFAEAEVIAEQAIAIARRRADSDILALGLNICGRSAAHGGRPEEGLAQLDEAMVELLSGAVSPIVTGVVYCSVIEACEELVEVERARDWTRALDRWCAEHDRMVTFSGRCLIHRASIALREGDWDDARTLAMEACERLRGAADEVSTGRARYLLGEIARLTGNHDLAESEYRAASDWGHDPQPGLALLRLGQGRRDAAVSAIRRLLADTEIELARAAVLPAAVEILLADGDTEGAIGSADELAVLGDRYRTVAFRAAADRAAGEVAHVRGDADSIALLRRACHGFRGLPAPYDTARTRLLLAGELERAGDRDSAEIEREGARRTLTRLGATPDLDEMVRRLPDDRHGLSRRELEVLGLVATGITNQQVADELCIALRTVDRHVENILRKLDVPSRTAAASRAHELQLL